MTDTAGRPGAGCGSRARRASCPCWPRRLHVRVRSRRAGSEHAAARVHLVRADGRPTSSAPAAQDADWPT